MVRLKINPTLINYNKPLEKEIVFVSFNFSLILPFKLLYFPTNILNGQ